MASPRGQMETTRAAALGALIRAHRRRVGSLEMVAERIPMSASNLSRLENGKQGPPSDRVIEQIAAAISADPKELLRAAGRTAGPSFEEQVLDRLDELSRDLRQVKEAVTAWRPSR